MHFLPHDHLVLCWVCFTCELHSHHCYSLVNNKSISILKLISLAFCSGYVINCKQVNGIFKFWSISNTRMKIWYAWINKSAIVFQVTHYANISLHLKLAYWNRDIYWNSSDSLGIKSFHKLKHWNLPQSYFEYDF